MKYVLALLTALLFLSCTSGTENLDIPDASIMITPGEPPPCRPERMSSDVYHCGACGNTCSPADADRCVLGVCKCGENPPCQGSTDCRSGNCVAQDPEGLSCEFDDWCVDGYACVEGHCTFVTCVPEDCDGIDNDCDGQVDNIGPAPLAAYCYSGGPADGTIMLPCSRGVRTCISGAWTECVGEVPPTPEVGILSCDGVDNDCDGCVDGVLQGLVCEAREPETFDVLFVIDQSGSMSNKIQVVKQAVRLFSTRLSLSTAFLWGIVRVPGPRDGLSELYWNLSPFAPFESALQAMTTGGGGTEPQWDAVYEAVTGELMTTPTSGDARVAWRPGSVRIIILFTDEAGQTTRARRSLPPVMEADMCDAMTHGEVFIGVISAGHQGDFDDCAHRIITLPTGTAGTGMSCTGDSDCMVSGETCEAAACVTAVVTETASELDVVIADPCGL